MGSARLEEVKRVLLRGTSEMQHPSISSVTWNYAEVLQKRSLSREAREAINRPRAASGRNSSSRGFRRTKASLVLGVAKKTAVQAEPRMARSAGWADPYLPPPALRGPRALRTLFFLFTSLFLLLSFGLDGE